MSSQSDMKMDNAVGHLLRFGVSIAAAVVLTGWVFYLAHEHGVVTNYQYFHGKPLPIRQIGGVLAGVRRLDSRSILQLGILLLIATPVARVLFCVGSFAVQKDKFYVLVSSTVLAILIYSLFFYR